MQNVDWRLGESLEVIGQMSSVIREKEVNNLIKQRQKRMFGGASDVQNRNVVARMLQIDWIFAGHSRKKSTGFSDFVVALSKAPHESLFSTDLIHTLVDHFWKRYFSTVIFRCFLPFFLYQSCMLVYISYYAVQGIEEGKVWEFGPDLCLRMVLQVLLGYFMYFEVRSLIRDKLWYFLDVFNYVDNLSFILNQILLWNTRRPTEEEQN